VGKRRGAHDCEAEAGPTVVAGASAVEAYEPFEDPVSISGRHAWPVVVDGDLDHVRTDMTDRDPDL
jgi:hypothetical protein